MIETTNQMAQAALGFATNCLMHNHRGVINCGDKVIVYSNGSDISPESFIEYLHRLGFNEQMEIAFDKAQATYWAIVATNYQRKPISCDEINVMLWSGTDHGHRVVQMRSVMQ